ncbi:5-hydroxytryptamine receptor 3A-like [Cheilinus undulatus]|uniref:5-hydroxytryptamine receptor 3A-like n=1 Tax=Cheilinus undulatus TaxID=241271 RepID=UPI001BD26E3D|nr:5-hydroxytryptamine receptor 3A-like [Cheilinus undulatus]
MKIHAGVLLLMLQLFDELQAVIWVGTWILTSRQEDSHIPALLRVLAWLAALSEVRRPGALNLLSEEAEALGMPNRDPSIWGRLGCCCQICVNDGASSQCSYRDVIKHLNLTRNKDLSTMVQPLKDSRNTTVIYLDVMLYAILDMKEKEQQFVGYFWVDMSWFDDYISWDPDEFCNITETYVPTKAVWTPDVTIEEMTEKDKAAQSPYLAILYDGRVWLRNDMVVVSSCRIRPNKFPFDTQKCNLSFKSVIHSDKHLKFEQISSSKDISEWSLEMMKTQSEWLFKNMSYSYDTVDNFGVNQSMVIYTITMRRRSVLYIVNFILPVLLFLCLDLASFLISDSGGEKLSFKVTVLLAVTVMQLLLNEILPSSSNRIPLIAIYCIGIFGLMLLSLLETILVMYLMEKDSASQEGRSDKDRSLSEDCEDKPCKGKFHNCLRDMKLKSCVSAWGMSSGETSSELLQVAKEVRITAKHFCLYISSNL